MYSSFSLEYLWEKKGLVTKNKRQTRPTVAPSDFTLYPHTAQDVGKSKDEACIPDLDKQLALFPALPSVPLLAPLEPFETRSMSSIGRAGTGSSEIAWAGPVPLLPPKRARILFEEVKGVLDPENCRVGGVRLTDRTFQY
ncbi:MAG: hypothetical protein M1814_000904 [Vezdaea aestivalis]|nr:MAG: hypothetical protein M1814_000904 [Vezdaea aestivalis]